jgi:hypothetical protein
MPSQGVFSNEGVLTGDIKVLYQTINGKQHVKALNISNTDNDGDDVSISLNELEYISLPLSSSGEMTNLEVISITEKPGYYFVDVVDVILNDIVATQTNKTVGISPYLAESFFYNNYNALISNAEVSKTSFLRYDIDRTGGQVKPVNYDAIAGFGKIVFSEMTPALDEVISYSANSFIGEKLSPAAAFDNDRDLDLLVLTPELVDNLGIPQIPVATVRDGAWTSNSYSIIISSSFYLEVDDNANFDNSNNHYYSASLADQLYANNTTNYTYNPFKLSIDSGSYTSGKVHLRLKQRNKVVTASNYNEQINVIPFLSSNPSTDNYLAVDLYYADQQPYAQFAPVQDSNYTTTGIINARYNGSKTGEDDFSGISPAIAAKTLEGALYRVDEDNGFICSQSLADRDIVEVLFEGPSEFPSASLASIGYVDTPISLASTETLNIQGLRNRQPQPGDIIKISTEQMLIRTVTTVPSVSKYPYFDLEVTRGYGGTTALSSISAGTLINRYSGARMLTIDKSRIRAISNRKVWLKDNRNIVKTNDRGFVIEISEICSI